MSGCYLGVDSSGTVAVTNGFVPLLVENGTSSNSIGGLTPGARNIISGGIVIRNPGTRANLVQGNLIGVGTTGLAFIPNSGTGINVYDGSQSNMIGGYTAAARNIISGNGWSGVSLSDATTVGNIVAGNYIGLNSAGSAVLSNGFCGIELDNGTSGNTIGGATSGAGNVISGNSSSGVLIRNPGSSGNLVQGNLVGLNAAGMAPVPNGQGVSIYGGAQSNLIGGYTAGARNIISGNGWSGVSLSDATTAGNIVAGNYIGLNSAGAAALANSFVGMELDNGTSQNVIGGNLFGAGNVISGNSGSGVLIRNPGSCNNLVQGNLIGLDATGMAPVPNGQGVTIYDGAQSNLVGGYTAAARNIISGNGWSGVALSDANTVSNIVAGNYIGLNSAGSTAIGNGFSGVELNNGTSQNSIGGSAIGTGNVISGNANAGVIIRNPDSSGNVVQGNCIGLNASGITVLPNAGAGILMYDGARSNIVGGVVFGTANLISGNKSDGVTLSDSGTTNNTIRGNSIYSNSGVGIALNSSANHSAAAPSLTSAVLTTNTTVSGSLTSFTNTPFLIDFYSSPASPAQGMVYLGANSVTTSAGGSVSFAVSLAGHVPSGRIITATATDPAGNTSTMSGGVTVTAASSVHDGIPDAWRALYFGGNGTTTNSQSCATCDPDQDGMNNLQEFHAGTNPTNFASALKLNAIPSNSSNSVASFASAAGIVYRVQYRDDLVNGFWSIAADQVVGTGTNLFIANPSVTSTARRFYRLQVLW